MNIKEMADLATTIIGESIGPIPVDVRTIRYYETYGVMEKPQKKGRENDYGMDHLKRLLAIKVLQSKGESLNLLKQYFDNATKSKGLGEEYVRARDRELDEILRNAGIDPVVVEAFVEKEIKPRESEGEEEMKVEIKDVAKEEPKEDPRKSLVEPKEGDKSLSVTVTNQMAFDTIKDRLFVGSSFAFIDGPADNVSKTLYAKLHGLLKKAKVMERAVIHVDDQVELIGCNVTGAPPSRNHVCVLVTDKDCYREGDDVARIFVFDPESKDSEVEVNISLSGAPLDAIKVTLDDNGCGLVRFPTLVSGKYEASIFHGAKCSFETSRYELDPLSVSVSASRKSPEGVEIDLSAERFGKPMSGKAIARLIDDGKAIAEKEIEFEDGKARTKWLDLGQGNASIQLTPSDDKSLIASAPIPGSRKEEREDTVISRMGQVKLASLLSSEGAERERGVYVSDDGVSNTPISIDSVFCRGSATLRFSTDAKEVMVAVSDPSSGGLELFSLGDVKKGGERKVKINSAFAMLSVGAFVGEKPWEANSVVIRVSEANCKLESSKSVSPGEEMEVKLSSDKACSVLLKVSDNRVRAMYEPMIAIASKAKAWMSKGLLGMLTGNAWKPVVQSMMFSYGYGVPGVSGVSGQTGPTGPTGSIGLTGSTGPTGWNDGYRGYRKSRVVRAKDSRGFKSVSREDDIMRTVLPQGGGGSWSSLVTPRNDAYVYSNSLVSDMVSYDSASPDVNALYCNADAPKFYSPTHSPESWNVGIDEAAVEEEARRSEVDVVFCELFRVPKSGKTVKIRLPDRIAAYDVRAFFVSGSDWEEKEEKVVVSKPMYIEPMIPSVASEGDWCRAVVVNGGEGCGVSVKVDASDVEFEKEVKGKNTFLKWKASPGLHEVFALVGSHGELMTDKVSRIVEVTGEEIVLCQETRVLSKGKKYELEIDALSASVLPGIQEELKTVVYVAVDFQHSCCEQTSAKIVAACVAMSVGNDGDKDKACKAIVNGEARLRSMYNPSSHAFHYYPGSSVNEWASAAAARRLAKIDVSDAPKDVSDALAKIREMASDVLPHSKVSPSPMEAIYSSGKYSAASTSDVAAATGSVAGGSSMAIAEAAYGAACLLRSGRLDAGVEAANVVAKAMAPAMGGFHGTDDLLAYLSMVLSLSEAGVVPSTGGKVVVDGHDMKITEAIKQNMVSKIEAVDNAVAIRINRIKKIRLDEEDPAVPIEVKLVGDSTKAVKAGKMARLVVRNVGGYKAGDVVVVRLPQCLSRMIGGGKQKKFQVDFEGKDEVSIDLVAHDAAKQKMAVVVRNMYDASRIGSAGLINVSVS